MEHILLLSSIAITDEQFRALLAKVGLEPCTKSHQWFDATWTRSNAQIWVALDNGQLEDIDPDDPEILRRLGGPPRSLVSIELANIPESRHLALEFASLIAERWPAIVVNTSEKPTS